jgi:transposase
MLYLKMPIIANGLVCKDEPRISSSRSGRELFTFAGHLQYDEKYATCGNCGETMHVHDYQKATLLHLPFGLSIINIIVTKARRRCPKCGRIQAQEIEFKAPNHNITTQLYNYTCDLLAYGLTNKAISELTGLCKNTVKKIDKKRLLKMYTFDGRTLNKPEKQSRFLGIDEFKLHNNREFATHITDLETGHVLWIAKGKKKQVVYDFIEHVGLDWMRGVEAVACDMNSDFQEAFEDKCPHLKIVFDHFHIVKYFNDKVISEVRKDEQRRLIKEGDETAAKSLKGSKHILIAKKSTLEAKDEKAIVGTPIRKESELFNTPEVTLKHGYVERYEELLAENKLFFTCDIIKEKLDYAYKLKGVAAMTLELSDIISICIATENAHFIRFAKMLNSHFDGIISHAFYSISTGKIEGINNKIKTIRRQGYGYPDDEYFFLKIIDASRQMYTRNPLSHRKSD